MVNDVDAIPRSANADQETTGRTVSGEPFVSTKRRRKTLLYTKSIRPCLQRTSAKSLKTSFRFLKHWDQSPSTCCGCNIQVDCPGVA